MIRNLKALGLALVALCAFSTFVPGIVSAETFQSEPGPAVVTGTNHNGEDVFVGVGFELNCEDTTLKGTVGTASEATLSLHPIYDNCVFNGTDATVDTSGCTYVLDATTNGGGHLPLYLNCTTGSSITVTTGFGCTLHFGTQITTGGVKATNVGSGATRESTTHATVTLTFTKTGGVSCFGISGNNVLYEGTQTLKGYQDGSGGCTNIHLDTATCHEGNQKGIWWE